MLGKAEGGDVQMCSNSSREAAYICTHRRNLLEILFKTFGRRIGTLKLLESNLSHVNQMTQ